MTRLDNTRLIRAPRGPERSAKSWLTEAPLRMLMNNLDPDVAERPEELVVYGGIGRAARDWESFDRIVATLRRLEDDETLLVQSGKPVGVFRTHADAPRVLIANSNLVPRWATWEHFNELDRQGLMMYGQMTAGSWIYIGAQGIVQGTYETFVEMGRQHYGGDLAGRWILTAGLGGMGGAQPLAAVMAGASCLAVECQPARIEMRLRTGYLDREHDQPRRGAGHHRALLPRRRRRCRWACWATPPRCCPSCLRRGVRPDSVTDQTSAHDPINGYLPGGLEPGALARRARTRTPRRSRRRPRPRWRGTSRPCWISIRRGADGRLRQQHPPDGQGGGRGATPSTFPGFVPAYIRPLFCRGVGPFRWAALSGDPEDIYRTDAKVKELMPDDPHLHHWLDMARAPDQVPGPAGAHLLGGAGRPPSPGPGVQRDGGQRRAEGADRHRPRSPGFRLGGLAQPRDRGDGRRLRRGVGLAAAERPAQLRHRRDLGVASITAAASAWAFPSTPAW